MVADCQKMNHSYFRWTADLVRASVSQRVNGWGLISEAQPSKPGEGEVVTNAERWSAKMKVVTGGQLHTIRSEYCPSYVKDPTGLNWSPLYRSRN